MKNTFLILLAALALLSLEARAQLTVNTLSTSGLSEPYNVVEDANNNIYISDSGNNRIIMFDANNAVQTVLVGTTGSAGTTDGTPDIAQFNNPQGLLQVTIGGAAGLLVADSGNNLIRFVRLSDGYVRTLAGMGAAGSADNIVGTSATFNYPIGLTQDASNNVYIVDMSSSKIRVMNLNDPNFGVISVAISGTSFFKPTAIAYMPTYVTNVIGLVTNVTAGANQLWVADTFNNTIKLITLTTPSTGSLTTYFGSNDRRTYGATDSPRGSSARFNQPRGLLWVPNLGLLISDTGNSSIRLATNNPTLNYGPTNYAVITYAGIPGSPGLVDGTSGAAKFNSPYGLWQDDVNSYFVADGGNNAIRSIQFGIRNYTPVQTPVIGYVTEITDPITGLPTVVFHTDEQSLSFQNIPNIQLTGDSQSYIYYTTYNTRGTPVIPTTAQSTNIITAPFVNDGQHMPAPMIQSSQVLPDLTIAAIGAVPPGSSRRPMSLVAYGQFTLITATPINSNPNPVDPQHIQLSSATTNATIYYTLDGSDPTTNTSWKSDSSMSLPNSSYTNGVVTLKAYAHRNGFHDSGIYTSQYYQSNSLYDVNISFGFPSGEASSDFVGSPGQTFYAPVTLTFLTNIPIYSLQFNLTVTNSTANGGPAVAPGAYGFNSFLEKPIPSDPTLFEFIPPLAFIGDAVNPPALGQIIQYDGQTGLTNFVNQVFYNTSLNLLGVGWLERAGEKNLYDSTAQTLLTYSQPHDVTYSAANGRVVVGGYTFQVPANAPLNTTYQIQIGRPSATSDGIGGPGADVDIHATDNGSKTNGAINATKIVTVGQRKYVVGDVYPFQWFNAGDFGDTNIDNADVEQVFEAAVYQLNQPPPGSDFFDAMDSCGNIGVPDSSGIYTNAGSYDAYYPSTNNLSFQEFSYNYGYSNVVTQVVSTTNIFYQTNSLFYNANSLLSDTNGLAYTNGYAYLTNIYTATSTVYFTNIYQYSLSTNVKTVISFTYMDPYPGGTTYMTNAMDDYVYQTNIIYFTNSVVVLTTNTDTTYISNNVVVRITSNSNTNLFTDSGLTATHNGPSSTKGMVRAVSFNVANYNLNTLFDGDDSSINAVAFGDGVLDVCDVYVTFRRSLDPSLNWFRRFWNGVRVAEIVPNVIPNLVKSSASANVSVQAKNNAATTILPQVNFSAGEILGSAGQVVKVPICATIYGSYPLRVLMLSLTVEPLDGSPALTTPVQFIQTDTILGVPFITDSRGNGNYSSAWLNTTNSGLTGTVVIGTLDVTVPTGASASAAYAIHFDHASASPNGLGSFPKQTLTGLITLSNRTNSSYGDGIPDAWRLRWFGTVNNYLSVSNACPTSDGINNWQKFVAGVDPNTANDFPSTNPKTTVPAGFTSAIHWPTVSGKQYAIERSTSLFSGKWTAIATNTGTGMDMEYDDNAAGAVNFYRVRILP